MLVDAQGNPLVVKDYWGNDAELAFLEPPVVEEPDDGLIDGDTPAGVTPMSDAGFTGQLVFSDEFKDGSLNTEKWLPHYPDHAFWNATVPGGHLTNSNEPQAYDPSAITFDEDGMVFTFTEESVVDGLDYKSGMVCSYPSFNQTYGYFEAKLLLPNANDAWPAFWLFPSNHVWPFEIDVVENDGKDAFNLQTYHTFHYPRPEPGGNHSEIHNYADDVGNSWHTYGVLWEPTRIRWYVDGVETMDLPVEEEYANRDAFMIVNLAGKQESSPASSFSMKVGYVRAWEL